MIFSKAELLFEILKIEGQLYEIAVGAVKGQTPRMLGQVLDTYNTLATLQVQEDIEAIGLPAHQMAREILDWIYLGKDRPEWLPEGV